MVSHLMCENLLECFNSFVPQNTDKLYNQKRYIKYMVRTQLYIFTQNSTHNYMFRP